MDNLIARITAARDIAAAVEYDIRIREFLRAITVGNWQSAVGSRSDPCTPERLELSVDCHFRSWYRCLLPDEMAQLAAMSQDELARTIGEWIQAALRDNMLSFSNPPLNSASPANRAVGSVVTFIYDKDCRLIGKKWA